MKKFFLKIKNYFKSKGFTLVELLAVIVILAIIMLIAIPAVLSTLESARRKTFSEYVDKSTSVAQKQLAEDQMMGNKSGACVIYNIKNELSLSNTGKFDGWVLINVSTNDIYITLFNDDYVLISYKYNDSSKKIDDFIEKRNNDNEAKLIIDYLCNNSSCSTCDSNSDTEVIVPANIINGKSFNNKLVELSSNSNNIKHIVFTTDIKDTTNLISTSSSENPIYMWFDTDTIYVGSSANRIYLPEDASGMFSNLGLLESLDVSIFDTSKVTNMASMFYFLDSATEITGLEKFDTSNVTDMSNMFSSDFSVTSLNVSNFNTSSVTNMSNMFSNTYSLKNLDVSHFITSSVTDMSSMFNGVGVESLDLSNFDTSNVKNMNSMFCDTNIAIIDLRSFNTSNVTNMGFMFEIANVEIIYVSDKWDVSNVTDSSNMFYDCEKLRNYAHKKWDKTYAHTGDGGYLSVYP